MKTIAVPSPTETEVAWFAAAAEGAVCIQLGNGQQFVLEPRDTDFEREVESLRSNDRFMETINRRSSETFTHEEMLREFGLT
ncbi:MAG: hypothetical protein IAE77_14720 [Prosthecobacter sp.]|jgi:hypothetical protein|uniref:hypothetical protein n=1 Tax=Prosthecobacter sp. TaxID=1965333 RepID=UPI001A03AB82|nr:hypothetical protein [Prosthecobacter sp.]MBE2284709.1 hypothetical protein [Prosthecobacter sp.]